MEHAVTFTNGTLNRENAYVSKLKKLYLCYIAFIYESFFNNKYTHHNAAHYVSLACKKGYYGTNCGLKCSFPHYGHGCTFRCNCSVNECDNISGCKQLSTSTSTGTCIMIFQKKNFFFLFLSPGSYQWMKGVYQRRNI